MKYGIDSEVRKPQPMNPYLQSTLIVFGVLSTIVFTFWFFGTHPQHQWLVPWLTLSPVAVIMLLGVILSLGESIKDSRGREDERRSE